MSPEQVAVRIVERILFDLDDRKGFSILDVDTDTLKEIREEWKAIIVQELQEQP